jgi:hypothetical protein
MPDIEVRVDGRATTLHGVLRGGRHVLVVSAADVTSALTDSALWPYLADLEVVTGDVGPVILVRPDGHVAARGRPGRMPAVTRYLRDLFGQRREPAALAGSGADRTCTALPLGNEGQRAWA